MRFHVWMLTAALLSLIFVFHMETFAEDNTEIYRSDFTEGEDGWYPRSMGDAVISITAENTLKTEKRSDNWHSPGRDFDLIPGGHYVLSVWVKQDEVEQANFLISVAHSVQGAESYENLASAQVKKGEWTELKGTYEAGEFEQYVLYVETTDAPELSFEIKDFCVDAPYGLPERQKGPEPMVIEAVEDMPSLKELYADYFDIGTCIPQQLTGNADAMAFCLSQFSIFTPENELKPDSVLDVPASRQLSAEDDTAVAIHLDAAAPLLDFALENGARVHGHVLVWHSQTPDAFFHEGYDSNRPFVTREVMLARMENYIAAVMKETAERWPGVIVSWDVVNEAIDDSTGKLRDSLWLDIVGEDFVSRAFELARKYAPEGTLLCYNDYNTAYFPKQDGIVKLVEELLAEGTIDGYGFQMHNGLATPTISQLTSAVERFSAMDLRLRVSELDITVGGRDENNFRRQADLYGQVMSLLLSHRDRFEAVEVWGLSDNMSWRASQYPLLFDANRNPKPAFWAVAEAVQNAE